MKKHKQDQEIYIPNSAILWTGERSVVYVQIENEAVPTYQFREVKVGSRGMNTSRIDEGLISGERIVTEGAFSIDAAAQLSNNFSMMNRNVSIKKSDSDFGTEDYRSNVTDLFLSQIDQVVLEYLDLKDALVDTDAELSAKEASQMLEDLEEVDMKEVSGEGHVFWMEKYRALKAHGEKIANAKSDVEEQRNQFDFLSEAIISTLKAFGTNNKEYFVQFCPMAKNDQGANWISTADTIRNPYFGDKMMKCGVVKLTLN
jgi:Cu(I)/Ag(I) efflux system membrane fusion protein